MKRHIREVATDVAHEMGALDAEISPESLARFQQDQRVWPVELWMKVPAEGRQTRLEMVQFHPDPCQPNAGSETLERHWMQRNPGMEKRYIHTIRECPERIIQGSPPRGPIGWLNTYAWERDNGKQQGHIRQE